LFLSFYLTGTVQGKFQREGIIGEIDQFLNEQLPEIKFKISSNREERTKNCEENIKLISKQYDSYSKVINSACGFWRNGEYFDYQRNKNKRWMIDKGNNSLKDKIQQKPLLNVLWIHGDSQARRLLHSLEKHILCRKIFKKCDHTYTWTYKHFSPDSHDDRFLYTGADFNESKFVRHPRVSF